ncbi:hypothetical protein Bca4012_037183 [Brassica carinata]|uniref:Uncharacterized protein n=1 Tax=Brassica carinata TaxID=52824 RepID=A0A8X7WGX4_BRACI|nr:hypothetical protein Bca52824_010881 [Brassica carinata]
MDVSEARKSRQERDSGGEKDASGFGFAVGVDLMGNESGYGIGYVNDEIHQAESLNVKTQTWEPAPSPELEVKVDRAVSTSIFFLLPSGNVVEIHVDGKLKFTCLGPDLIEGDQKPQYTVPPNIWLFD